MIHNSTYGTARPLDGVRVLDFTANIAGPMAMQILVDLGAEVIKIEPEGGEAGRHILSEVAGGWPTTSCRTTGARSRSSSTCAHPRASRPRYSSPRPPM